MQLAGRVPRQGEDVWIDKRRQCAEYGATEVSQAAVETNMAVYKDIVMPTVVLETRSVTCSAVTIISVDKVVVHVFYLSKYFN